MGGESTGGWFFVGGGRGGGEGEISKFLAGGETTRHPPSTLGNTLGIKDENFNMWGSLKNPIFRGRGCEKQIWGGELSKKGDLDSLQI